MATYFVDNTGVVTTASTDSDSIFIQSAAIKNSTILAGAGNDTINFLEGAAADASALGPIVRGADGDDSITISAILAFSAGNAALYGGKGNDTISISGGSTIGTLKTNEGNDLIDLSGAGTYSAIGLSNGADTITIEQGTFTTLNLGNGHDSLSAASYTFGSAATINFGKGNDTVTLAVGGSSAQVINAGDGKDSVVIDGIQENSTLKGGGGADTITLSGDAATTAFIAGNGGNDLISLSGANDGLTVGGGEGNDTIEFEDNFAGQSAYILGGKGDDSIYFVNVTEDDDYSKASVVGGAGADSITFSAATTVGSGEVLGTLVYSAFSDSTIDTTDVFKLAGVGISGDTDLNVDYGVDLTSSTVGEVSASVLLGDANFSGNIASNIVTLSGSTYNVSSVTAVAGTVDTLTLQAGVNATVHFTTKGGTEFLFVQGGTAGTDDDSIINLGDLSGAALAVGGSAAVLTFSGQV